MLLGSALLYHTPFGSPLLCDLDPDGDQFPFLFVVFRYFLKETSTYEGRLEKLYVYYRASQKKAWRFLKKDCTIISKTAFEY